MSLRAYLTEAAGLARSLAGALLHGECAERAEDVGREHDAEVRKIKQSHELECTLIKRRVGPGEGAARR